MFSAKKIMGTVGSLNVDCTIPSSVTFGPAPTIPNSFVFGPSPNIAPATFTFGPSPHITPATYTFGPAPMVSPASFQFGPTPEVSVSWGLPPTIEVNLNGITNKTPASATASGNSGEVCWDSNYLYVCVGQNSWKRTALASW